MSGNVVYVPCADGVRAVRVSGSTGHLSVLWHASSGTTGSPVLGGGLLWSVDPNAGDLHGLDPGTGRSRVTVHIGETSRFATPALWGPYAIVPTMSGVAHSSRRPDAWPPVPGCRAGGASGSGTPSGSGSGRSP